MTVFALKLIAIVSMLIDHTAYVLGMRGVLGGHTYTALRGVGRIAFPIFCFLIVNGFEKSSDRRGYIARLALFAAISQAPFSMVFKFSNYLAVQDPPLFRLSFDMPLPLLLALAAAVCVLWFFTVRRDVSVTYLGAALLLGFVRLEYMGRSILSNELDVFYTLAMGLCVICLLDALRQREERWYVLALWAAALSVVVYFYGALSDYSYMGVALIALLYLCRGSRAMQAAALAAWCAYAYWYKLGSLEFFLYASLSVLPILLYNGEPGRRAKWIFYLFYPLHLTVLALLNFAIK